MIAADVLVIADNAGRHDHHVTVCLVGSRFVSPRFAPQVFKLAFDPDVALIDGPDKLEDDRGSLVAVWRATSSLSTDARRRGPYERFLAQAAEVLLATAKYVVQLVGFPCHVCELLR